MAGGIFGGRGRATRRTLQERGCRSQLNRTVHCKAFSSARFCPARCPPLNGATFLARCVVKALQVHATGFGDSSLSPRAAWTHGERATAHGSPAELCTALGYRLGLGRGTGHTGDLQCCTARCATVLNRRNFRTVRGSGDGDIRRPTTKAPGAPASIAARMREMHVQKPSASAGRWRVVRCG